MEGLYQSQSTRGAGKLHDGQWGSGRRTISQKGIWRTLEQSESQWLSDDNSFQLLLVWPAYQRFSNEMCNINLRFTYLHHHLLTATLTDLTLSQPRWPFQWMLPLLTVTLSTIFRPQPGDRNTVEAWWLWAWQCDHDLVTRLSFFSIQKIIYTSLMGQLRSGAQYSRRSVYS